MRNRLAALALGLTLPLTATAQPARPGMEIGFRSALTRSRTKSTLGSFSSTSTSSPNATHAPYVLAQLATLREDDAGSSDSQNAVGAGIGYRNVVRQSVGLRYELMARRWTGRGRTVNEIALVFGVGAVLGKKAATDASRP